jgi:glucose/arabinose dehydrogenase
MVAIAAATLTVLPPLSGSHAAATERVLVIDCRDAEPNCWPTAFAFTPNGRHVFYAERFTGQIRIFNRATGRDRLLVTLPNVATDGEQGVLGLALHPRYPERPYLFVYYTAPGPENRITRLRDANGSGMNRRTILELPAAGNHNGGVIHFGPDGRLYAVIGDVGNPANAQDLDGEAGKVLRMTGLGTVPADNPFPDSLVYSFGHRNSFGFAFDPVTDVLWQTENGPQCDDEINRIVPGRNYGWGAASDCPITSESGPNPTQPEKTYTPTIAPTGAAFCDGCRLGAAAEGDLLFGAWNDGKIRRLELDGARNDIVGEVIMFTNPEGVLSVEASPDDRVYFSDPNGIYRLERG